jgi:hypothetical protein
MKTLIILFTICFIIGCGDNPVTNNGNVNSDTLLYSNDSIGISGTGLQGYVLGISLYPIRPNLRLTFDTQSDCDTTLDNPRCRISLLDTIAFSHTDTIRNFNSSYTLNVNSPAGFLELNIVLIFNSSQNRYLTLRNLKVYN